MEQGAFGGPGAPSVPWTMPPYKTATGMQEDLIHPGSIFPKQRTKSHTDDRSQSPQVRRKLNLECSEEFEGAEKKQKSTKMDKDQKPSKHKTSADDSAPDKQSQLSDNKSNSTHFQKRIHPKHTSPIQVLKTKNTKTSTSFQKIVRVQKTPVQLRVAQMIFKRNINIRNHKKKDQYNSTKSRHRISIKKKLKKHSSSSSSSTEDSDSDSDLKKKKKHKKSAVSSKKHLHETSSSSSSSWSSSEDSDSDSDSKYLSKKKKS